MAVLPGITFASVLFTFQFLLLGLYAGFVNYTDNINSPVVDSRNYYPRKYHNYLCTQLYFMQRINQGEYFQISFKRIEILLHHLYTISRNYSCGSLRCRSRSKKVPILIPCLGSSIKRDLSMLIFICLYVFNVVCTAILEISTIALIC